MRFLSLVLAFCLMGQASGAQDASFTVKRGETIRIFSWSFFGDTCRKTSLPEVRAVRGPKLGVLTKGTAPLKIRKVVNDSQRNCIGKSVEGTVVNYTAGNTAGQDSVRLARKRLSGKDARYNISITVK